MDDEATAKCRMIAEFEGRAATHWFNPDPQSPRICLECDPENPEDEHYPDYPHDLNATMRAARRLPNDLCFVTSTRLGTTIASIESVHAPKMRTVIKAHDDPARAAFECLAQWLMERKG